MRARRSSARASGSCSGTRCRSMRALFFDGSKIRQIESPIPRYRKGESLVRVRIAGICSTDIEILRGYLSFEGILGHEFVGTVESSCSRLVEGQRVVGEINIPCGKCALCRQGLKMHCASRKVLGIKKHDGAFADYLVLPTKNLHPVPTSLEDEEAVFTELLAAACEIAEQVYLQGSERILVLGDGRLAAMVAQVIRLECDRVEVMGRSNQKLAIIGSLGIRICSLSKSSSLARKYDVVIDCTGNPEGIVLASSLVVPRGKIILKSTYAEKLVWNPASLVIDEITVIGSRCGPFERALDLLSAGKILVRPFITAVFGFESWKQALRKATARDSFKVLIRM